MTSTSSPSPYKEEECMLIEMFIADPLQSDVRVQDPARKVAAARAAVRTVPGAAVPRTSHAPRHVPALHHQPAEHCHKRQVSITPTNARTISSDKTAMKLDWTIGIRKYLIKLLSRLVFGL